MNENSYESSQSSHDDIYESSQPLHDHNYALLCIDIIIKPDSIQIYSGEECVETNDSYLHIKISPTSCANDIASIKYWHNNKYGEIVNVTILNGIIYSMVGCGNNLVERAGVYISSIPENQTIAMLTEYSKYMNNGILLDGLVAGIGAYLVFLKLIEDDVFPLPFLFNIPYTVSSALALNKNMMRYLSLPLLAITKLSSELESLYRGCCNVDIIRCNWLRDMSCKNVGGVMLHLVTFIQNFINMWDLLFIPGPNLSQYAQSSLCVEVVSGISQCSTSLLIGYLTQQCYIIEQINCVEDKLRRYIDETLQRIRREIDNLTLDNKQYVMHHMLTDYREEMTQEISKQISKLRFDNLSQQLYSNNNTLFDFGTDTMSCAIINNNRDFVDTQTNYDIASSNVINPIHPNVTGQTQNNQQQEQNYDYSQGHQNFENFETESISIGRFNEGGNTLYHPPNNNSYKNNADIISTNVKILRPWNNNVKDSSQPNNTCGCKNI